MPIQKFVVELSPELLTGKAVTKHQVYAGTIVLQSSGAKPTESATLLCTGTGGLTAKGQLVRMVLYPQSVDFKFDTHLNLYYIFFGIFCAVLFVAFLVAVDNNHWTTTVYSALSILCQSVNPMMPVAIVWAQAVASKWLRANEDKLQCLAPARIPIAGKIHAMVFDKTGIVF